ncbi:hypothetical protein J2W28_006449 [Variovorax boronicumulans]|uniref:hypothetical protein n=1 Tax=Variovorax TaxID=34072 RepID=UPI0027803176|nr:MULTISPECIES: hypothetical protein [Variovorax]MDP9995483.1 hypothetical protein [Variovorax boronicumulans]MDQ0007274.1 hypothetical protein [Variovorax boronicumulans]MDQ0607991.1 hypothetical protein [Variovorax sp. W1I1]
MPWAAAGAIGGALITANAAGDAADAQSGASQQSTQLQMMMAAQQRQDLDPWVKAGSGAQNLLSRYLGTGSVGSSGVTSMGLATGLTPDQVRAQLLSRFTKQPAAGAGSSAPLYRTGQDAIDALGAQGAHDYFQQQNAQGANADRSSLWTTPNRTNPGQDGQTIYDGAGTPPSGPAGEVDYEGLDAAIAKYYDEQKAQEDAIKADPTYGSLLRPYRNGEEFSFTGKDLLTDPGYKFGLDQGTMGIERGQAARGNFLSGAAMKELARYNEDYAGTKFNEGFGRAQSTWNTNLNAYDSNRNTIYNFLTGQSTLGQNSAARVGAGSQQAANAAGQNIAAAGNASSAASIVGGNALTSGLNSLANTMRSNNNPSSAAGWNSLISAGPTPYGQSSTSVSGPTGWTSPTNFFAGTNGSLN